MVKQSWPHPLPLSLLSLFLLLPPPFFHSFVAFVKARASARARISFFRRKTSGRRVCQRKNARSMRDSIKLMACWYRRGRRDVFESYPAELNIDCEKNYALRDRVSAFSSLYARFSGKSDFPRFPAVPFSRRHRFESVQLI